MEEIIKINNLLILSGVLTTEIALREKEAARIAFWDFQNHTQTQALWDP